jgi:hypothetical protein
MDYKDDPEWKQWRNDALRRVLGDDHAREETTKSTASSVEEEEKDPKNMKTWTNAASVYSVSSTSSEQSDRTGGSKSYQSYRTPISQQGSRTAPLNSRATSSQESTGKGGPRSYQSYHTPESQQVYHTPRNLGGTKARAGEEMTLEQKAKAYDAFMRGRKPVETGYGSRVGRQPQPAATNPPPRVPIPAHIVVSTDTEEKGDDNSSTVITEASLERERGVVAWVKPTSAMEKKANEEEKKKKRRNKERRERAGVERMTGKLARVSANDTAEQKQREKRLESAKRKALNKDKETTAKITGGKKGPAGKKSNTSGGKKAVAGKTKATRVTGKKDDKAEGGEIPRGKKSKVTASKASSKAISSEGGGATVGEGGKRNKRVEKHIGACHHGTLLDMKAMDGQKLMAYLKPGEYMSGRGCEQCKKSCSDFRKKDQVGSMLYYCDRSIVAWKLAEGDGDKDGEICNLILCTGCFLDRSGKVGGRRQRARCQY